MLTGEALLVQLADALEALHSLDLNGLTLTPAMVFLETDPAALSFMLVPVPAPLQTRKLHTEDFLRNEQPAEALPYIAQERLRVRPATAQADLYALGVVAAQILWSARLPVYADKADFIRAAVAGLVQKQILATDTGNASEVIHSCLTRRPKRPRAAEAHSRFAAALTDTLRQPGMQARRQVEDGNLPAALEILSHAMRDAIRDRDPQLYLLYAEILARQEGVDVMAVVSAARRAAERIERLLDEKRVADPVDRYFTAHLFTSTGEVLQTARQIFYLLGELYRQEGLVQKAIAQYDRALQVAGDDGPLLLAYAAALLQADRPGESLRALDRAEKIGGADYRALHLEKARAMERQGMLDEAISAYRVAQKISPDGATWAKLGRLYLAKGPTSRARAEAALRRAIKTDPRQLEAAAYLANLALDRQDVDTALTALAAVHLPSGTEPISVEVIEKFLEALNAASEHMADRLQQRQDDPEVHRLWGDLFLLRARLLDDIANLESYARANDDYLRALLSYEASLIFDPAQPELSKKLQSIQDPWAHEQSELEYRIDQEGDSSIENFNRLALIDWRLGDIAAGHETPESRLNALAHLKRAVELLGRSLDQNLNQKEIRRLYISLAERLRRLENGA